MLQKILKQIDNLNSGLEWVKRNKPEEYNRRFLQLVEERRKLRILANAERNNPGIAAFGQSQVGKSYLMNCILQDKNTPFLVESSDGWHNFIDEINPIGGGAEATGVVTRFSSYSRNPDDYNKDLPIRFRALNVRDIMMIICESYFNQFNDYTMDGETDIIQFCDNIQQKYQSQPEISNSVLTADDLLEMKLYFKLHINNGQIYSVRTSFFDRIAIVIDRIPVADYADVFSILWHYEGEFTKLFKTCMGILQRIRFAEYVYLPIGAVLHFGVKEDTIMSVSCLQLLYEDKANDFITEAYGGQGANMEKLGSFTKSELCTICSEVVIKICDKFLVSTGKYDDRGIKDDCKSKLPSGEISMTLLGNSDLLDFPGARASEKGTLATLNNNNTTLMYSYLRGKVSYLFNKYNEEQSINILLYCHHQKNNDATDMWQLLNRWVNDYVGDTVEKRADFIRQTEVSPLFHIGTMWNLDLKSSDNPTVGNTPKSILNRWDARFKDLLLNKCFHTQDVQWVKDWDGMGHPFQNCYMLRDFTFSNQVYEGFKEKGKEQSMQIETEYYENMRKLFIKSNEETRLFKDAGLAWDTSASIGNDGSLYIIQQLSKVASKILSARENQIRQRFLSITSIIRDVMKEYYISDDTAEILAENIRKANGIFRELEFTCQESPDYLGHLLQALQFTEAESFKEVHRLIPELGRAVHDTDKIQDYELIRKRCNNFADCKSEAEKWAMFVKCYRFRDKEEASEYLQTRKIDSRKLFKGEAIKRKNSAIISDDLVKLWQDNISGVQFMNAYAGAGKMDEIVLANLVSCVISTAQNVNLVERIENEIAGYVDILNTSNINEDLIADMIATTISDFVMDFGYRYLHEEQIQTSRRVAKEEDLSCYIWTERERKEHFEEDEMTALFNDILSSSGRYTPAYEANYNTWLEYMYIAFIAHINVPEYNRDANDALKQILESLANS